MHMEVRRGRPTSMNSSHPCQLACDNQPQASQQSCLESHIGTNSTYVIGSAGKPQVRDKPVTQATIHQAA